MSQCFAFNQDGLRCTSPGGHNDDHQVVLTFTDDDVFIPVNQSDSGHDLSTAAAVYPTPPVVADPCVVCGHKDAMHTDEFGCQGQVAGGAGVIESCGCRSFV